MHNFFTETTPLLEKHRRNGALPQTHNLIRLIDKHSFSEARQLISAGTNVQVVGEYQKTALHAAVRAGSVITAEALVAAGANTSAVDKNNWTPLMDAVRLGDELMVKCLVDKTKAINQVDNVGKTALDYAKESQSEKIVVLLMQQGAKTANEMKVNSICKKT